MARKTGAKAKFSKTQILGSTRYKNRKDLLAALLDDSLSYSHADVEKVLSGYLNQEVRPKKRKEPQLEEPPVATPEEDEDEAETTESLPMEVD